MCGGLVAKFKAVTVPRDWRQKVTKVPSECVRDWQPFPLCICRDEWITHVCNRGAAPAGKDQRS